MGGHVGRFHSGILLVTRVVFDGTSWLGMCECSVRSLPTFPKRKVKRSSTKLWPDLELTIGRLFIIHVVVLGNWHLASSSQISVTRNG
jgi:hypothetical protein